MKFIRVGLVVVFFPPLLLCTGFFTVDAQAQKSFFENSLHHRGEGMRYWYEKDDGFMQLTGIPYKDLGCKNCHVKSCDKCHAVKDDNIMTFSTENAKKMENCLPCHSREKLSMKFDQNANMDDVHFAADMTCADCHKGEDVHGNGKAYTSMRDQGAITAECGNCHTKDSEDAPAIPTEVAAHKTHGKTHDCAACHVQGTMACMNCHFSEFLDTGVKKGNFVPVKDWVLLINYEGKVTSGTAMTFVHRKSKESDLEPFVVYAPYFTHSIAKKGRDCKDCHATDAATQIADGKNIQVTSFKEGKLKSVRGAIPAVPDLLKWEYLDKKDGKWKVISVKGDVRHQMACYGTALTKEQLKKLAAPQQ